MIANFPDEDGFAQIQNVDDRFAQSVDLKVISNFDQLIHELEAFRKPRAEKFNVWIVQLFNCSKNQTTQGIQALTRTRRRKNLKVFLKVDSATYYHLSQDKKKQSFDYPKWPKDM